jgi:hypothetical protein
MTNPRGTKVNRYPIEVACVAWADLLGYGAMLEEAAFNPKDARTIRAIERLRAFQRAAVQRAERSFPAMPINDGVAYFKDLSPRTTSVTADFLRRACDAYAAINEVDQGAAYPGARMVIAVGPRVKIGRPKRSERHLKAIIRRLAEGVITTIHAINEAYAASPVAGFVPALQANFAFSRAYLANEAGTSAGLGGAHCYIDLALFEDAPPNWIQFARRQEWRDRRLNVWFGQLASVDWRLAARVSFAGVRSQQAIAAALGL